jgi:hypothetical protein
VVLLQVSSRWRPIDSLVPVYPATPLRGHKTTVRRDWHPDPLADLPTATARRRGAPVTPAKHHFATEPLLLVHWKSALIPEWNRHAIPFRLAYDFNCRRPLQSPADEDVKTQSLDDY